MEKFAQEPFEEQDCSNAFAQRLGVRDSFVSFYLRKFTGFDANGKPVHEEVWKFNQFLGKSALPELQVGFSTSANYKKNCVCLYVFSMVNFGNYIT